MATHFHMFEVYGLLLDDNNTTSGGNMTNSTSSSSSHEVQLDYRVSNMVVNLNKFIASLYAVLMVVSIGILAYKMKLSLRLRTGLLYTCYVLVMVVTRFAYLVNPSKNWVTILLSNGGSSKMCFIDLLPELLFISIFLLMTITLAIAWTKTRKVKVFKDQTVMLIHTAIVCFMLLISGFLSIGIRQHNIRYAYVILWEAYYVITVSGVAVFLSAAMGTALYLTFYKTSKQVEKAKNSTHQKFMTHLLILICLTVVSFILKGIWNLILGSIARKKWRNFQMDNASFGTLWFGYYFFTELLPLGLALYQQYTSERLRQASSEEFKPASYVSNKYTTRSSNNDDSKKSSFPGNDALSSDSEHLAEVELDNRRELSQVSISDGSMLNMSTDSLRTADSLTSLRSSAGGDSSMV